MRLALVHLVFLHQIFSAMRYISAILICSGIWMTGCDNTTEHKENTEATEAAQPKLPPQSKLDEANTQRLMNIVTKYYAVKNALVGTDPAQTNVSSIELNKSAEDFKKYLSTDSVNANVLTPYVDTIITSSKTISLTDDPTTEKKRVVFETLSTAMFDLLKAADLKNAYVYRQYCPMAFNDKGAYWLSNETEIRNPYFGKKMLSCGEVTDTLK